VARPWYDTHLLVEKPFGLLITWTCYGTWLPGDARGYVSDTLLRHAGRDARQNGPGSPYRADEAYTRDRARGRQRHASVLLTRSQARCVAESLIEASRARGRRVHRGALMANHVHAVILDCPDDGPGVRRALNGPSQAVLSRQEGGSRRWWTRGGSNRYLRGEEAILDAAEYVARQQGMLAGIDEMRVFLP